MKRILPFLFILICASAFAGGKELPDTVIARLHTMQDDSAKVYYLNGLLRQYINQDPALAQSFGERALQIATEADFQKGIAMSEMYIGIVQKNRSDYSKALTHFRKALSIYERTGDKEGIGKSSNNLGNVFREQGNQEQALQYYLKALAIFEEAKNNEQISILYNNIALVHYELANLSKSEEYHQKSLAIKKQLNDLPGISASYNNLGTIYRKQDNYDKALEMFLNSLRLDEQLNDRAGIAVSLNNIGMVHFAAGKYEEALQSYFKALEVSRSVDFKDGSALALIGIGDVYNEKGQYTKALGYFERAMELSVQSQVKQRIKNCYSGIALAYYGLGDYKNAFDNYRLFTAIKDSIVNEEATSIIARMQEIYNTEKKDRQIELLEKNEQLQQTELKRKSTTIASLYAGIFLVLLLVFFIYRGFRQKQKANQALSVAYSQIEEKNKDITDSINYAKKIQTAILPDKEVLHRFFPESFVLYRPKDIVSGDFYYFSTVQNGYLIAVADCTGHGVPGAFMSMIGNDLLNHIILEKKIYAPAEILNHLHEGVKVALKQDYEEGELNLRDGMDIAIVFIDKNMRDLRYAGAHRPLLVVSEGTATEIKPDKISIGGGYNSTALFNEKAYALKRGDSIYLFSDGYVDQFGGPEGKKFMSKNFRNMVSQIGALSAEDQDSRLNAALNEWMGGTYNQVDDILVLGLKV